jgi:adenylosuccinate synthase
MHKVLPNGVVSPNIQRVMIGPQSVFDPAVLKAEIDHLNATLPLDHAWHSATIIVHQDAVVLQERHKLREQETLSKISSTMQGSMEAIKEKMERNSARDCRAISALDANGFDARIIVVTPAQWRYHLGQGQKIIAEGAQGYSLGLNAGFWPYCTSRDCTPARFLADMSIPHKWLTKVVGTARVHPIRVGSTADGFSGHVYPDQEELSWEQLGVQQELTTVTKRVRRVFTFSRLQINEAIWACQPDEVFLNFCNYDVEQAQEIRAMIDAIGTKVQYMGFGPKVTDVIDVDAPRAQDDE